MIFPSEIQMKVKQTGHVLFRMIMYCIISMSIGQTCAWWVCFQLYLLFVSHSVLLFYFCLVFMYPIKINVFVLENADRRQNKQGLAFLDLLNKKGWL